MLDVGADHQVYMRAVVSYPVERNLKILLCKNCVVKKCKIRWNLKNTFWGLDAPFELLRGGCEGIRTPRKVKSQDLGSVNTFTRKI